MVDGLPFFIDFGVIRLRQMAPEKRPMGSRFGEVCR